MERNLKIEPHQVLEIIRFKVQPEKAENFVKQRAQVDEFITTLAGHVSTELLQMDETNWCMLIRWQNDIVLKEAQKVTETSQIISDWITANAEFVSFDKATVQYVNS